MWNVKEIGSFEDYDYAVLNNNTVSVFKYKGEDKNVVVPAVIADLRVTEIAERAFCGNLVERITLSDGIVTIGKQAFEGVVNFLSIDIPASVQQLGEAFVNGGVAYFEAAETEVVLPDENIQYTTKMVYNSGTEAVPIDGLRYSLNSSDHTAQLNVTISRELVDVVIPREVEHAGVTYTVVGIKDEALWYTYADIHNSNESTLNSVYIPETVVNFGTDIFLDTSPNGTVLYCKGEISAENADKIYGMGIVSNENAVSNAVYDTESQLWYSITDGKAVVARQGKNVAETVTIPATITANGTTYNVTEIGSAAFYGRNGVKEVTVGANVTVIGAFSFDYCKGLGAVKFANGSMLETIQNEAFNACTALKTVQIPASVTEIFHLAFQDCNALQGVYVDSLAAWCGISFYDDKANPLLRAHNLYVNDTLVEVLEIPASVTEIKSYAFNGFGGTSLRLHDNVTSIVNNAFYNCSVLSSVTIPASVQSMGEYAFNNCPLLILYCQSESRPSGWNVGFNNFEGGKVVWNCDSNNAATDGTIYLETNGVRYRVINNEAQVMLQHRFVSGDVTILDQVSYDGTTYPVTSIVENAFDNCADVTSVTIGRNVATIYSYAFRNCTGLISVTLSDNSALENIASYAFYGCSKLTTVTFAENGSLETIGSYAFSRCYALSALELPATLKTISNYAFSECRSLLTVIIRQDDQTPSALKTIGGDAFNGCPSLVTFTIPASVTSVGSFVFSNSLALTVYCETTKGNAATMWNSNWGASSLENSGFAVVWSCKYNTVAENGYEYMYGDGLRFAIKDGVAVVAVQPRNVTSVTIPAYIRYRNTDYAVVGIADYAFSECKDLTEVTFNTDDNFTRIGNYAFRGCENLASITVPDSVTDMGRSVFYGCPLLTA
ncbi:MAG: leucine-rich repeat domain-containing protein [Clostridiales bacterium]|nr:leucine-rich repeat domain-containing protein [Clostridiales bacterium]